MRAKCSSSLYIFAGAMRDVGGQLSGFRAGHAVRVQKLLARGADAVKATQAACECLLCMHSLLLPCLWVSCMHVNGRGGDDFDAVPR